MLLFCDGMRHISTALIPRKYSGLNSAKCLFEITPEGRFANCLRRTATGIGTGQGYVTIAPLVTRLGPWVPQPTGVVQFAIRCTNLSSLGTASTAGNPAALIQVWDSNRLTAPALTLHLSPEGTFSLTRYDSVGGSTTLASSSEGFIEDQFQLCEFSWIIGQPAGEAHVRVNTVPVLDFVGDTRAGGTSGTWNSLRAFSLQATSLAPAPVFRVCDLVLMDQVQVLPDDLAGFLGDVTIDVIIPDGVGLTTEWTPSVGANWSCVNELPANQLAWVAAAAANTRDLYTFTDLPPGFEPIAAHHCILAQKTEPGGATLAPSWRPPGGITYDSNAQGVAAQGAYYYILQPYDLNPATLARPTRDEINASEFGVVKTV